MFQENYSDRQEHRKRIPGGEGVSFTRTTVYVVRVETSPAKYVGHDTNYLLALKYQKYIPQLIKCICSKLYDTYSMYIHNIDIDTCTHIGFDFRLSLYLPSPKMAWYCTLTALTKTVTRNLYIFQISFRIKL